MWKIDGNAMVWEGDGDVRPLQIDDGNLSKYPLLSCTSCGGLVLDCPVEVDGRGNVDFGNHSFDTGMGLCVSCGGDPREPAPAEAAREETEAQTRRRLGANGQMFFDARVEVLNGQLKGANLEKFQAMSYARKVGVITKLIERGAMI